MVNIENFLLIFYIVFLLFVLNLYGFEMYGLVMVNVYELLYIFRVCAHT